MKISTAWAVFLAVQAIGIAALFGSGVAGNPMSSYLWQIGFVALLPGDNWPAALVEHLLWSGPLSGAITYLEVAAAVATNAVIWFFVLFAARSLRKRDRA